MLKKFVLRKIGQLFLHSLFWCVVLLFYTSFFGVNSSDFSYILSFSLFLMPITIATTYVFIYKIIPDYLVTKRYFLFGFYSLCAVIISAYLIVVSVFYGLVYLSNFQYANMAPVSKSLLFVTISVYSVVITASAFKLLQLNQRNFEATKKLETVILETQLKLKEQELNYLKMQIHPHFLFNTLNTLYGFAIKKADETPEMILKLSNLLDYLLYKIDQPFVQLQDEIEHIKDYIELEKMRFNATLKIDFITNTSAEDLKIAPMLLLPFVENSFKHGVLKAKQLHIKIQLFTEDKTINFSIENTSIKSQDLSKGIGLKNIEKRLALLYKNKYTLDIKNETDFFSVNLKLNLD